MTDSISGAEHETDRKRATSVTAADPIPQETQTMPQTPSPAPSSLPLEGVKMAVDFVKQLLTLSSGLIPIVSGGIFALRANSIHIPRAWYYAVGALLVSIVIGMLSFGSFIGQVDRDRLSTRQGKAPAFVRAQIAFFLIALGCIVYGTAISAAKLH